SAINSAGLPSMWCLSIIWTSSPSLNSAMLGEDGGKGTIWFLAVSTASVSTPAKTVTKWSGVLLFCRLSLAAGLALAAAQPHTEFTTTKVVPSCLRASSTASEVCSSWNPAVARSALMGLTNSSGYIDSILLVVKDKAIVAVFHKTLQGDTIGFLGKALSLGLKDYRMIKWVAAILGYFLFRLPGAILGFFLGSLMDGMGSSKGGPSPFGQPTVSAADFELHLIALCSIVIKADGQVSQRELDYVRQYFLQTYGREKANAIFKTINRSEERRV